MEDKAQVMDIGGVFELVMIKGAHGYHGHYTNRVSGIATTFTAPGMSKKQIVKKFWDRAREFKTSTAV